MKRKTLLLWAAPLLASCTETTAPPLPEPQSCETLPNGEYWSKPEPSRVKVRVEPRSVVLAPGQRRTVDVVVDPDFCEATKVTFDGTDEVVATTPEDNYVEYGRPSFPVEIVAGDIGTSTITVSIDSGDPAAPATATLEVEVMDPTLVECDGASPALGLLEAGGVVAGEGDLAGASISLPESGANTGNFGSYLWNVEAFDASVRCAGDIAPPGHIALGPAVELGPTDKTFARDVPMSVPINPALMPEAARWRHLAIAYSGPRFLTPRTVTVTDPRVHKVDGVWRVSFRAPRLGTYQAVVPNDAGTRVRGRRLTHRAVIGVSMGGAGAMQFGLRHHHLFDVVGAMGGPVDWTWLVNHLEKNHLGGFRPIAPGTTLADIQLTRTSCTADSECAAGERCLGLETMASGKCTLMPETDEPYEHASTFNTWWYEYPAGVPGHGGGFDRAEYLQIFRDLALTYGNPIGFNEAALYLPTGADPDHPAQKGNREGDECKIYVKPYDGPNEEAQKELFDNCPIERCQHTQVLTNYYDNEYNPDGTFPVITFCDGSPQDQAWSPYANTWIDQNIDRPVEVALAVDYNANGKRDELEPVIRSGHETYLDFGADALPSALEPGYGPDNLDPSGDDYDPRYNPSGLELNGRYDEGEAYQDYGLDSVLGTGNSEFDHGEGDGVFSLSPGLQRFWDYDSRSMVRGGSPQLLSTPLDDDALARLDFWTDGGTRDLFNFAVAAEHFMGSFLTRGRSAATFGHVSRLPGLDPEQPDAFNPAHIVYADLPGVVNHRYGKDDPTEEDIETGSGQHAGTLTEFANRLQASLYYVDSRWPDAPRALVSESAEKPAPGAPDCEVTGNCTIEFTSSFGRTGPVQITLPPGYAHEDQQGTRYPVIYILHGYGMTPEDLGAAIVFLANWMNGNTDSQASRLGKAILVYADGRCREHDGKAECIRGNFFADSIREDGAQADAWWLELIDYIDQNYRTMGESVIDWTE